MTGPLGPPLFRDRLIDRVAFASRGAISEHQMQAMTIEARDDAVLDLGTRLVLQVSQLVSTEKLVDGTVSAQPPPVHWETEIFHSVPVSTWAYFKDKHLGSWWLDWWCRWRPPKYQLDHEVRVGVITPPLVTVRVERRMFYPEHGSYEALPPERFGPYVYREQLMPPWTWS